jgi:23S rRNA (uracil1939-C5)-methyltransferase
VTERLAIARLGHRGDGIADAPAGEIFVPYALPGETAEVDHWPGHRDRRRLIRIERASADRIAPICPHFGTCGGCALQHLATARYRAWKRALVVDALAQAGLDAPVGDLIDAHGEGRRRAVFHARRGTRDVLAVGFAAVRAHQVVAIDRCPIFAPGLAGAIEAAWAIAETLASTTPAVRRKPLDIQVTGSEDGLDIDVRGSGSLTTQLTAELARVAERHRLARVTRHGELIAQRAAPTLLFGRARVVLPPGAFLQATAAGEAAVAALVAEACGDAQSIADLFAGVGPLTLRLAERARVTALDNDTDAIAALRRAATTTPRLKPIAAEARDLFRRPLVAAELKSFDCAVFDPPRQGAQAQARELAASAVPVIVAVSCNPATFARDAQILADGGYRLTRVTPIDQFLYSAHVELAARFER